MSHGLLIVEDEEPLRDSLARVFRKVGYRVDTAETAERGLQLAETNYYDVIISDIILPGMDGIELLKQIRETHPDQVFIVNTAYGSLDTAVQALKLGAYDYILKPIIHEEIKRVVRNAITAESLRKENRLLKRQLGSGPGFESVIGSGGALQPVLEELQMVVNSRASVMLLGETGTGKGFMARLLHENSDRREAPFLPINCSAIPETLIEGELFGHVRGAFTGAGADKPGLLTEADGGTVFLDEIGDMSLPMQAKLLKVLEDREIRPLGSSRVKKVDLRFVTATNRNLEDLVSKELFRKDLYYRLNVITVTLPPLRQRTDDLDELVDYFLGRFAAEFGVPKRHLSEGARNLLAGYHWPGNIRELQNVLERATLIARSEEIGASLLPKSLLQTDHFVTDTLDTECSIEDYTRAFIKRFQDQYGEQELADKLGITRRTLWEKRKKWDLKRP